MTLDKILIAVPYVGMAIMMWAAWRWRRNYMVAERMAQETGRLRIRVAQLEHRLEMEQRGNASLRKTLNKMVGERDKRMARERLKAKVYGHADWQPRPGIVSFDSKTGQWTVTS